jgi:hypothetical protein
MDKAALEELQQSMRELLQQNKEMNEKISNLQKENEQIKTNRREIDERISGNLKSLEELNEEALKSVSYMLKIKEELSRDGRSIGPEDVNWFFNDEQFKTLTAGIVARVDTEPGNVLTTEYTETPPDDEFDNTGREEKLDLVFGLDGDLSAKSLRRFIEKYKVVKKINMTARMRGWDSKEYRADKLKLALHGDAFDFVAFEDSMDKQWTKDDEEILEKLKDRYLNVQAVEMNILKFEKSVQEGKELLNEYLVRLQQLVKDAYEGQVQEELDLRVAWKFVSGISDEKVRRKLMEEGWMKNRREAKPLEELLKVAEISRQTEEAVKAMKPEMGHIAVVGNDQEGQVNANRFRQQSSDSSTSKTSVSSGSSGMTLDFLQCFYCNKKHRGGWFYCEKRKREDPKWRPTRKVNNSGSRSSNQQSNKRLDTSKDF